MRTSAAALLLGVLAGCSKSASGPVSITLGEDACAVCRMIISEGPHAAQARLRTGTVEMYDDIGCLVRRLSGGVETSEVWVVDRPTGRWIDGRAAAYVRRDDFQTPMAYNLAAFADAAAARDAARAPGAEVFRFKDLSGVLRDPMASELKREE